MEQEALYFGENGIIKSAFHKNKKPVNINEVDIERIALSDKGNAFPSPLCIKLPQMNVYAKYFDRNNTYINLLLNDKKILEKYNKIRNKIKGLFKKECNSKPVYNDKYIETEIKIYDNRVYTNFSNNIPKDNEYCVCLSVILLDSIFVNSDKEYYPQILLEECKYAIIKKIVNTIYEDLELSESDDE